MFPYHAEVFFSLQLRTSNLYLSSQSPVLEEGLVLPHLQNVTSTLLSSDNFPFFSVLFQRLGVRHGRSLVCILSDGRWE